MLDDTASAVVFAELDDMVPLGAHGLESSWRRDPPWDKAPMHGTRRLYKVWPVRVFSGVV